MGSARRFGRRTNPAGQSSPRGPRNRSLTIYSAGPIAINVGINHNLCASVCVRLIPRVRRNRRTKTNTIGARYDLYAVRPVRILSYGSYRRHPNIRPRTFLLQRRRAIVVSGLPSPTTATERFGIRASAGPTSREQKPYRQCSPSNLWATIISWVPHFRGECST